MLHSLAIAVATICLFALACSDCGGSYNNPNGNGNAIGTIRTYKCKNDCVIHGTNNTSRNVTIDGDGNWSRLQPTCVKRGSTTSTALTTTSETTTTNTSLNESSNATPTITGSYTTTITTMSTGSLTTNFKPSSNRLSTKHTTTSSPRPSTSNNESSNATPTITGSYTTTITTMSTGSLTTNSKPSSNRLSTIPTTTSSPRPSTSNNESSNATPTITGSYTTTITTMSTGSLTTNSKPSSNRLSTIHTTTSSLRPSTSNTTTKSPTSLPTKTISKSSDSSSTRMNTTMHESSTTYRTTSSPRQSTTNTTSTSPRSSTSNTTNTSPGSSNTKTTSMSPGSSSKSTKATSPLIKSTTKLSTGHSARSTTATLTRLSATELTIASTGLSTTNTTSTLPRSFTIPTSTGSLTIKTTASSPESSTTSMTSTSPRSLTTNIASTLPGSSSKCATTTSARSTTKSATTTSDGSSTTNMTTTSPGSSTTSTTKSAQLSTAFTTTLSPEPSTAYATTLSPEPSTSNTTTLLKDCHAPENISNGIVKFAKGTGYGSKALYICESGFEFSTSLINQTAFCNASGEWEPSVNNCTDIDECARNLDDCDFRANCSNTEGSFSCKCRQGFEDKHFMSQGKECEDIDECAYPHPCYANGTRRCINVIGQYFCACNQGYTGKRCEKETDECENSGSCGVNAICTNTLGSYYCHCNDTYPSGNPYIHCYENTIIHFEPDVDPIRGNTVKMTSHAVPFRYTYFGVQHYVFRAAMDGFISLGFQQVFDRYAPADPSEWVKSSHFNSAYDPAAIIAPLWSDLDTTNITNAGLFVHYFSADETGNITDSNTQNAFESAMHAFGSYVNDSIFEPKVLIEATWANVTVAFQPLPPQKFVKRENATMQAILISDGISTYIMFNYAQDEWNIKPGHRRFGVAGYSYANFTGNVIADDVTFVNLSTTSTNSDLNGRHIFNVTQGDPAQMAFLQTEEDCRSFYNNQSAWACISEKNKKAYICPCQEDFVKYDLSLHKVDIKETLGHGVDYPDKTACYQEWFFNFGGVKQTCCYQFHSISTSQYAGGVAMFENDECGADVGYKKCCVQSKRLCHLFYKMNPPNDCTGYEFPSFIG